MSATKKLLAFDLGAESGRGVLGTFDGAHLRLAVVHRFPNVPVAVPDGLYWDALRLYGEMLNALRLCASTFGSIDGVGVDAWGVDFALIGRGNVMLGNPRHYRDPHTETIMETAFARVPRADIFRQTGLQFMQINSLFQLLALQRDRSPLLDMAESLLFIPDLFHFFMTGVKANETTIASTSQMLDPTTRSWAYDLTRAFGISSGLLGTLVPPGRVIGPLRTSVAQDTGLSNVPVIAPASHDTAAAVVAVPAKGNSWAFISSGTWSLMGVEIDRPLLTADAQTYNFTNEGGVDGTVRLLKNIMGLWLVQECRRAWERAGQAYSYEELVRLAVDAPPFVSLVNPDDPSFLLPANMPAALTDFCRRTGQAAPAGPGAVVRCALESLALAYRWVLDRLEALVGRRLDAVHVVGGGSQNGLLCQMTADACNRPVVAGPLEATAIGNVLMQAVGLGIVGSLAEAREVVRNSFEVKTYTPQNPQLWDGPYARFQTWRA
jgi:rhamnulokinase